MTKLNARIEKIKEKPPFCDVVTQRSLIIADGIFPIAVARFKMKE